LIEKFSKMDVSLIAEAVSENSAPPDESLVFGLKPHESEIASVVVRKPSSAKGLLRRGFLNPSYCDGTSRCSPEPGLGCPQKLPMNSILRQIWSCLLFLLLLPWIGLFFVLRILVQWWGFCVRGMRIRLWLS
jgi:hypothetical protein